MDDNSHQNQTNKKTQGVDNTEEDLMSIKPLLDCLTYPHLLPNQFYKASKSYSKDLCLRVHKANEIYESTIQPSL